MIGGEWGAGISPQGHGRMTTKCNFESLFFFSIYVQLRISIEHISYKWLQKWITGYYTICSAFTQHPTTVTMCLGLWRTDINILRISLMVQWLRTDCQCKGHEFNLVREDSTCHRATKPMGHNYWAHVPRLCALQWEKPPQWEAHTLQLLSRPHSPQPEKAHAQQQRLMAAKNKKTNE